MNSYPQPSFGFPDVFSKATAGDLPYPYQGRLAQGDALPALLNVPTGLGKTLAVVMAWYWRRFYAAPEVRAATPRRLVFCLPMRVLVSQTEQVIKAAMDRLKAEDFPVPDVQVLMGGQIDSAWQEFPEGEQILIGTQDQLISRALNRGYAMKRTFWPVHFAWLNNDCLWVLDETQLMGPALETTAQLAGLRQALTTFGPSHTLWMSATLEPDALKTADHKEVGPTFVLGADDLAQPEVRRRLDARKSLSRCAVSLTKGGKKGYTKALADAIWTAHQARRGTLTMVVLNRVARAQAVYGELKALAKEQEVALGLIHSRMRPRDRRAGEHVLASTAGDRILVATQAIEAGVDVSAATLFTELAPWSSLVQRFGRCNRYGELPEGQVCWIDVEDDKELALPYGGESLAFGRAQLPALADVGPASLQGVQAPPSLVVPHGFRRRDLLGLFDTTSDLLGADLDVSRYIRDADDTDVAFFWRAIGPDGPAAETPEPHRDELVSVSIGAARTFFGHAQARAWWWSDEADGWLLQEDNRGLRPGQVYMVAQASGGYDDELGWTGVPSDKPTVLTPGTATPAEEALPAPEGLTGDRDAARTPDSRPWVDLAAHTDDVVAAVQQLHATTLGAMPDVPWAALGRAARHHDWGKAHPAFQSMLGEAPDATVLWAKSSGAGGRRRYLDANGRPRIGFRHELASALAYLQTAAAEPEADLITYLIACHHGKVRLSLRATPSEIEAAMRLGADQPTRFARGIWEDDELPAADLGGGVQVMPVRLSLAPMAMGEGSWLERMLALRDAWGPFRLAYLEALFRVADWRGSAAPSKEDPHA